jgi:hypothetical protein
LLFLVYINDLPNIINNNDKVIMFADDTSLLIKKTSELNTVSETLKLLEIVETWFSDNNLFLNMKKTNAILFSLRQKTQDSVAHALREKSIDMVEYCRFLGVTIDGRLQWTPHIDHLCNRLSTAIFAIKKIKAICGQEAARSVYFAYFHSIMTYGILFWGQAADSSRVFILQKRAIRAILGTNSRDSCREAFKELNILTMPGVYIWECLLYARANLSDAPRNADFHEYNTRNRGDIRAVRHRLTKSCKSFTCISVRLFNKLPLEVRLMRGSIFGGRMKAYLVHKTYYSVDDMLNEPSCSIESWMRSFSIDGSSYL